MLPSTHFLKELLNFGTESNFRIEYGNLFHNSAPLCTKLFFNNDDIVLGTMIFPLTLSFNKKAAKYSGSLFLLILKTVKILCNETYSANSTQFSPLDSVRLVDLEYYSYSFLPTQQYNMSECFEIWNQPQLLNAEC